MPAITSIFILKRHAASDTDSWLAQDEELICPCCAHLLAAIVIGLISSFIIGISIFQKELNELGQNDMIKVSDNIVALYKQTQPQDLEAFMDKASQLTVYPIQVFQTQEK